MYNHARLYTISVKRRLALEDTGMAFVTGDPRPLPTLEELKASAGEVRLAGIVHKIRDMGTFAFLLLRTERHVIQCVADGDAVRLLHDVHEGFSVRVNGTVRRDERAAYGFEVRLNAVEVLSRFAEPLPVPVNKLKSNISMEASLEYRPAALRHPAMRAAFKVQEGLSRAFREYLTQQGFTEIHSPKIVAAGAEGGSNIFKLQYFDRKAFLCQSPQFYKQAMVPVFGRVFEVGPVFRAERHNTSRHLNEYTSLDFEMGFIESFADVMDMECGYLKYALGLLEAEYAEELAILETKLPKVARIPTVRFMDAKKAISERYGHKITSYNDIEPAEEVLVCRWAQEEFGSEFIFVTHYPSSARPFYAMDDPADPEYTLSFDLLFRGIEITTGGQRIHDYGMQVDKMRRLGMDVEDFNGYLMLHKYGAPPHGGLGLGLERLTMQLLGLDNVRWAALFPRDMNRVEP
jgi:nondiscriminating aspartyl-tRNA synthetase